MIPCRYILLSLLGVGEAFHHRAAPPLRSFNRVNRRASFAESQHDMETLKAEVHALQSQLDDFARKDRNVTFAVFDTNNDGGVSAEELRLGLSNKYGTDFTKERCSSVVNEINKSGLLQVEEFDLNSLRRKLNSQKVAPVVISKDLNDIFRVDSKQQVSGTSLASSNSSNRIASADEEKEAELPTRLISILAYLLPLLDGGGDYGHYILAGLPFLDAVLTPLISLFQATPFLGLGLFLLFSTESQNAERSRLLRFNLQQAMLIDISLFFPGLLGLLPFDPAVKATLAEPCNDAVFVALLVAVAYSCLATLITGKPPDKVPLVSQGAYTAIEKEPED